MGGLIKHGADLQHLVKMTRNIGRGASMPRAPDSIALELLECPNHLTQNAKNLILLPHEEWPPWEEVHYRNAITTSEDFAFITGFLAE